MLCSSRIKVPDRRITRGGGGRYKQLCRADIGLRLSILPHGFSAFVLCSFLGEALRGNVVDLTTVSACLSFGIELRIAHGIDGGHLMVLSWRSLKMMG